MKGQIISIEGTDGCGKQTQAKLLCEYLKRNNKKAILQSFPNYASPSSSPVKMYLNCELGNKAKEIDAYQSSVLFGVDRLCTMQTLKNFVEHGGCVVLDRYVESNLIHQACKIDDEVERTKYSNWLMDFEYNLLKLPKPDKIFFLNMPIDASLKLAGQRDNFKSGTKSDIHERDAEYMKMAYNCGIDMAQKFNWEIIDCVGKTGEIKTIEEIHEEIIKKI